MIEIIYGAKGSGKTKKILDSATASLATVKGDVVFLAATSRYRMEIKPQIRFIDALNEGIKGKDSLVGFIKGLLCGNYDIEKIYIDGFYKMLGTGLEDPSVAEFFLVLDGLSEKVDFIVTVSADKDDIPACIAKYIK